MLAGQGKKWKGREKRKGRAYEDNKIQPREETKCKDMLHQYGKRTGSYIALLL